MANKLELVISGDAKGALRALGDIDSKSRGVSGRMRQFGKVAAAGFAAAGAGVAALGVAAFKAGEELDKAYDTIRVGTGATGKAFDGLKESFRNVARDVPAGFQDVGTAIADLNTRTGATGKELESLAAQSLNLARITGGDLQSQIASSTRVFGDWGIKVRDQAETMDQLFRASQMSGAEFDTLATQVVQFGSPLRNMGFTLQESIALFGQFEKTGVNIETSMAGMKQAVGNFADDGIDPMQGFRDVLSEVEAGTFTMSDAIDVFGKRAAPDMFAALVEGKFKLDDFVAGITGGSDSINQAAKDTEDFGEKWQRIKNRVLLALEPVASKVFDSLGQAMDHLGPLVERLVDRVAPMLQQLGVWFSERLPGWIATGRAAFEAIVGWVRANWPAIRDTVAGVMESVGAVIGSVVETIQSVWDAWGDDLMRLVNRVWPRIQQVIEGAINTVRGVIEAVLAIIRGDWGAAWDAIHRTVQGAWQAIHGVVMAAVDVVRGVLAAAWQSVFAVLRSAWDGITAAFRGYWELLVTVVRTYLNTIKTVLTTAWGVIKAGVTAAWNGIKAVVEGVWKGLVAGVRGYINTYKAIVSGAWRAIKAVTQTIWRGIKGTITGALDGIKAAIRTAREAFSRIWDGIKGVFRAPVNAVLRVVVNPFLDGVRKIAGFVGLDDKIPGPFSLDKFHSGGEIGGPRGRERPIMGLGGEGVANLRAMDMLGPAGLAALNKGDRSAAMEHLSGTGDGIGTGVSASGQFSGPYGAAASAGLGSQGVVAAIGERLLGAGRAVSDRVRGMPGAIREVISQIGRLLDGLGGGGVIRRLHAGAMRAPMSHVRGLLWDLLPISQRVGPNLQPGVGWRAMWDAVKAQFPDAQLFSSFRPGSITSSGNLSYHAMGGGRAIDISPRMDIFDWIHRLYGDKTAELIFTPAGGRQLWHGQPHVYSGEVAAQHWDHVHWAMRNGALVKGGRGGVDARIGEGPRDELVTPLPPGFDPSSMGMDPKVLARYIGQEIEGKTLRFVGADRLVVEGAALARRRGLRGAPLT